MPGTFLFRGFTNWEGEVGVGQNPGLTAGALDTFDFNCRGGCPVVDLEKECIRDPNTGQCEGDIEITITNSSANLADAPATMCTVTDTLDPDGAPINIPLTCTSAMQGVVDPVAGFDIPVDDVVTCMGDTGPLAGTTVDEASVDCEGINDEPPGCIYDDTDRATCACDVDNFKCYAAKFPPRERFRKQRVDIVDQFGTATVLAVRPTEICNPVDKNGEGIEDPEAHLMCYKVRKLLPRGRSGRWAIRGTDQFGSEELRVSRHREICLPALKNCVPDDTVDPPVTCDLDALEQRLAHLQCYLGRTERGTPALTPIAGLSLEDQFESQSYDARKASLWCNPLFQKNAEQFTPPQWSDPLPFPVPGTETPSQDVHYKCYDIGDSDNQDRFRGRTVEIEDQFHPNGQTVRAGRPTRLCEPAVKQLLN